MLVLAADTSGKQGSIALADCSAAGCELLGVSELAGGAFSAQLVPQVASLLSQHGRRKSEIDAFAVVSGPGSFTGLRVGLAAIKALGEALAMPIVAVSLFEVMGEAGGQRAKSLAAIDAGRDEVYVGELNGKLLSQRLLTRAEFLNAAHGLPVIAFDANVLSAARAGGLDVQEIPRPLADLVVLAGWKKIQAGEFVSPEELEANYIRRSDAEIFSAPR